MSKYNMSKIFFLLIKILVNTLVSLIDALFQLSYRRFYVLEEIARVPYYSFVSVFQFYQWLGVNPPLSIVKLHFKQTVNETWHLLIMKELGGGDNIFDRIVFRIISFFYYWFNILLFFISPKLAYYMMELIEEHAFASYIQFINENKIELKSKPLLPIAKEYFYNYSDQMKQNEKTGKEQEIKLKPETVTNLDKSLTDEENYLKLFEIIAQDELEHSNSLSSLYSK
jgi:ubiquinol oxidase